MKRLRLLFVSHLALISSFTLAQTSVDPVPNSLNPNHRREFYAPKRAKTIKSRKVKVTRTPEYEFYKRVEMAAKNKQRILRKLSKQQFSDPAHFGHKRKPKKRPPHRMRLCTECHIRH